MLKSVSPQLSPTNSDIRVVRLTPQQQQVLEAQFGRVKNPHSTDLALLAAETGLQEMDVQVGSNFFNPEQRVGNSGQTYVIRSNFSWFSSFMP